MNVPRIWTSVIIKGLRKYKRLSESDLADILGIERHRVRLMESGGRIPEELIPKLNDFCNLEVWNSTKLKEFRKNLGCSQKEIASMLGVEREIYCDWEQGRCTIPYTISPKLNTLKPSATIIWSGKELKKLRKKAGWTLQQAAAHVQKDPSIWSRWERGLCEPPNKAALLRRLEEVLPKEWIEPLRR